MIEFYYSKQGMNQAYTLLEKMQSLGIVLYSYLDKSMVDNILNSMGKGGGGRNEIPEDDY